MDSRRTDVRRRPPRVGGVLFDEEIDVGIVECLRRIGLEAVHSTDLIHSGASDAALLWLVQSQGWPLVVVGDHSLEDLRLARLGRAGRGLFVVQPRLTRRPHELLVTLVVGWTRIRALVRDVRAPFAFAMTRRRSAWSRLDQWYRED